MSEPSMNRLKRKFDKNEEFKGDPPVIEKVSPLEAYSLKENGERNRRICGAQRRGAPQGWYCMRPAGSGTTHKGMGPCKFHDTEITKSTNTSLWYILNKGAGLPAVLGEYLENAENIQEDHLVKVDDDIKILYALQSFILSRDPLTNLDIDLVLKVSEKIFKAKELKKKLDKEVKLDTKTVKEFVNQIFSLIISNASQNVAKRIMTDILDKVVIPFNTEGRVKGNDFSVNAEYEEVVEQLELTTKKESK